MAPLRCRLTFIKQYDKVIWVDSHLMEILLSSQKVFYILDLFIQELLPFPNYSQLTIEFQQKQVELLKINQSILEFLRYIKQVEFITKWSYLENGTITTHDIVQENYAASQKISGNQKKRHIKLNDNFKDLETFEAKLGFKTDVLLQLITELSKALSGNCKIRSVNFPEPIEYKEIMAQYERNFMELMQSEEKADKSKKTYSSVKQNKIMQQQEAKEFEEEEGEDEDEEKTKDISERDKPEPLSKRFKDIRDKFQEFVGKEDDEGLKISMSYLFAECKEPMLIAQMNDFLASYWRLTGKKHSERDILDINAIKRLNIALVYKKAAIDKFGIIPESKTMPVKDFLEEEFLEIETILSQTKQAIENKRKKNKQLLKQLNDSRDEAIKRYKELSLSWIQNKPLDKMTPIAKKRLELMIKVRNLANLDKEIEDIEKTFSDYLTVATKISHKPSPTTGRQVKQEEYPNDEKYSVSAPHLEIKDERLLDDKISAGIKQFEESIKKAVAHRMQECSITGKKGYSLSDKLQPLLHSAIKFMALIKNAKEAMDEKCQIYVVGGLVLSLLQKEQIVPADIDIITDVDDESVRSIASIHKWEYKCTLKNEKLSSFKFRFQGVNIDVVSFSDLNLEKDSASRDINLNALYLTVDQELSPFFAASTQLLEGIIDACLLDIAKPGLIRACTGHLANWDYQEVIPSGRKYFNGL